MRKILIGILASMLFGSIGLSYTDLPIKALARFGVIVDSVDDRFVDVLGKGNVMRKEAELSIANLEAKIIKQRELVAAARVDTTLLAEKIARLREQLVTSQEALAQLADWIELGEPVELTDGSFWQISALQTFARSQMEQHKVLQANLEVYERAEALHQQAAERGYAQLRTAEQSVANMYAKLDLLDAQLQLLSNLKTLPTFNESQDALVALDQAGTLIDELIAEVDRETQITNEVGEMATVGVGNLPPVGEQTSDALVGELRELAGLAR